MTLEQAFDWSEMQNLFTAFQELPIIVSSEQTIRTETFLRFDARIPLKHDQVETSAEANCRFWLFPHFETMMPRVSCADYWVRKDIEWHINTDGTLCYELAERWKRQMSVLKKRLTPSDLMYVASNWCLHHTQSLLFRHLHGYENNMTIWPTKWKAFRHGNDGTADYFRSLIEKRRKC